MTRLTSLVAALSLLFVGSAFADDDDAPSLDDIPHITMVGTARIDVAPDIATITLGVTTEKPTAKAAADENARKAQAVVAAAKTQGIVPADITTQALTLTQTFDEVRDGNGRITGQRPRGFAAENIVAIKVRDLGKVGDLAGSLVASGANQLDGVAFAVEHPEPILTKLTGEAVTAAKTQAQVAADASASRLGRVLLIGRPGNNASSYRPPVMARMKVAAPAAPPVEGGTTTLSTSVEVVWALEPK